MTGHNCERCDEASAAEQTDVDVHCDAFGTIVVERCPDCGFPVDVGGESLGL